MRGMDGTPYEQKDLLSAEDVARHLGVGHITVYRWCKEGRLRCIKIGKHWRIRRKALEDFLSQHERSSTTLVGLLSSFLRVPDNVLAIAQNRDILHRLDATFFRVGETQGGLLVKFYGGEEKSEDELRVRFEQNGLEVGRLEREGRFLMRAEEGPLDGRSEALRGLIEEEAGERRTVWASFDWVGQVDLNTALEQQVRLTQLVDSRKLVVKTATLEEVTDKWPSSALRQGHSLHSGVILASESELSLSRATPMPSSKG
jgi:excisionase family DNA binding protein